MAIIAVIREAEDSMYGKKLFQRKQVPNQVLQSIEQALHQKCNYSRQHGDRVKKLLCPIAESLLAHCQRLDGKGTQFDPRLVKIFL